jgi:hypothetical protein
VALALRHQRSRQAHRLYYFDFAQKTCQNRHHQKLKFRLADHLMKPLQFHWVILYQFLAA